MYAIVHVKTIASTELNLIQYFTSDSSTLATKSVDVSEFGVHQPAQFHTLQAK